MTLQEAEAVRAGDLLLYKSGSSRSEDFFVVLLVEQLVGHTRLWLLDTDMQRRVTSPRNLAYPDWGSTWLLVQGCDDRGKI